MAGGPKDERQWALEETDGDGDGQMVNQNMVRFSFVKERGDEERERLREMGSEGRGKRERRMSGLDRQINR